MYFACQKKKSLPYSNDFLLNPKKIYSPKLAAPTKKLSFLLNLLLFFNNNTYICISKNDKTY